MIPRTELLPHALLGFEVQPQRIKKQREDLRRRLDGDAVPVEEPRQKRRLSAAGRRRLIAATKKRWRDAKKAGEARSGEAGAGVERCQVPSWPRWFVRSVRKERR